VGRTELEEKLAAAETRRREAEERLREHDERLHELEEERESLLGFSALARQALADLDEYQQRLQHELAELRVAELRQAFADAVRARDDALETAAAAVSGVAAALQRVDAARAELAACHRRLGQAAHGPPPRIPPEAAELRDRWSSIAPRLEEELGRQLDYEMVEAAARSQNRLAFEALPEHLRELAKQRRRDIHR
jgi:chromosome segregation ATPase